MARHQERNKLSKSHSKRYDPSLLNLATIKDMYRLLREIKHLNKNKIVSRGVTAIF